MWERAATKLPGSAELPEPGVPLIGENSELSYMFKFHRPAEHTGQGQGQGLTFTAEGRDAGSDTDLV